ncbi:hypothetical protein AB4156_07405 [Cupriavidus sp. 2MCAB6]|uniref:hypothetical protein n=1 Tax=Cupriavidus sp. 2MCAB6 TaxID=3232981 RepID=UPI003F92C10C
MPDKPKKHREAPISYRPPQGLAAEFRARVRDSGMSINAFITAAVFGHQPLRAARRSPLDDKTAATLLAQVARINDRLNEVASREPPADKTMPVLAECNEALAEIRTCLMLVLGRKR